MQCFDTFRGFLHKLYAATMDGKGRQGTYNFYSQDDWGEPEGQGIGPCHTAGAAHATPIHGHLVLMLDRSRSGREPLRTLSCKPGPLLPPYLQPKLCEPEVVPL